MGLGERGRILWDGNNLMIAMGGSWCLLPRYDRDDWDYGVLFWVLRK
jgi:hypothetical protein